MRNIEIKAKIHDYDNICKLAEELSKTAGEIIHQDDTFYNIHNGRLKLRCYTDGSATLIRYDRDNEKGPKLSNYELLEFESNERDKLAKLDVILKKSLGIKGCVVKMRKLFIIGQTRVHVDDVEGLGHFMELEVVLRPEQSIEEGEAIAREIQTMLGVNNEDLIECAYIDLLSRSYD